MNTLKDNNIHAQIYYYLFLLLSFMLPLYERAVPIVIILIVVNWVVEGRFRLRFKHIFHNKQSLLIISFTILFLVYALSLVYSNNLRQGFIELEVKLSLLIFPVIFATIDRQSLNGKKAENILLAFIAGCLLTSLFLLLGAYIRFASSANPYEFIRTILTAGRHPSYISMYFSFSVAILAYHLLARWESSSYKLRAALVILIIYSSFFVLLLCSKAGIIAMMIVFLVFMLSSFQRKDRLVPGIILSFLAISFILSAFYLFPPSVGRFSEAFKTLDSYETLEPDNTEGTAERILIWGSALEAGSKELFIGHGIGDVKEELGIIYQKNQIDQAHRLNLNAHNEYLQTFVATGLAGMAILILSLLIPFIISFRKKNILYVVFLLIIGSNFLFESMLNRQAGVVFYAFFNVFFLFFLEDDFLTSDQTR